MKALPGLLATLVLYACSAPSTRPPGRDTPQPRDRLFDALPGEYSNFSQAATAPEGMSVYDLEVRPISARERGFFLMHMSERTTGFSQSHLLRLRAVDSGHVDLDMLTLSAAELGESGSALVEAAESRFSSGCTISLAHWSGHWRGATVQDACTERHPTAGTSNLWREMIFGPDTIEFSEALGDAHRHLEFRSVRLYRGWASVRRERPRDAEGSEWFLSEVFEIGTDGRLVRLRSPDEGELDYAVQLADLPWRPNEPLHTRLAVYNLESGEIQAYGWAAPHAAHIQLNLEWFQSELTAVEAERSKE